MNSYNKMFQIEYLYIIDGDSFQCEFTDFGPTSIVTCNLYNFDAPEIVSTEREKAIEVKKFLSEVFSFSNAEYYIKPVEIGKDGRLNVYLFRKKGDTLVNINTLMKKIFE